jgi:hypothetical protein
MDPRQPTFRFSDAARTSGAPRISGPEQCYQKSTKNCKKKTPKPSIFIKTRAKAFAMEAMELTSNITSTGFESNHSLSR